MSEQLADDLRVWAGMSKTLTVDEADKLFHAADEIDAAKRKVEWMQENWCESEFRFACRVNPSAPTKAMARCADKFVSAKIAAWDDAEDTCSDPYHGISCSDPDDEEENSGTVNPGKDTR